MGYVDAAGKALAPVIWDDEQRRVRLAALDALFFWLYDLGADDAGHVLEQFPIVREHDERAFVAGARAKTCCTGGRCCRRKRGRRPRAP